MQKLTNEELNNINGGMLKLSMGKFLVAGGIISFIIGTINGLVGPSMCSK